MAATCYHDRVNVELSERARKRVEQLVEDGTYGSVDDAVEAAVRLLEPAVRPHTSEEILAAAERGRRDFEAGRFRSGEEFAKELRQHIEQLPPTNHS